MKFKDRLYFLLSYTNGQDIRTKYPNFKTILFMNIFGIILYFIIPSFLAKAIYTLFLIAANLCFKETRGIVITFIPIILWVLLFSTAKDIPMSWRRPIDVTSLYNLEKKLGLACFKFNDKSHMALDLLAWLPYGIIHYIMPFLVGIYLLLFYKPGYTSAYLFFFGIMNFAGVLTQLCWPTSPPWYYLKYQTTPANYTMHGDPAGLQRIDDLFHINFYHATFTGNPLPWGAWPSLHSGFASYSALFLTFLYPKYCIFFFIYVAWIWWATMYLGHHYLVDLIGGFIYALISAIGAIIYLLVKKPEHRDYAELKSIMVQEYDYGLLTNEYMENNRYPGNKKHVEPVTDSEKKLLGGSTMVNGSTTFTRDDGSSTSSSNEHLTVFNGTNEAQRNSMITDHHVRQASLPLPNDPVIDRLSVVSNVDRDTSLDVHSNSGVVEAEPMNDRNY